MFYQLFHIVHWIFGTVCILLNRQRHKQTIKSDKSNQKLNKFKLSWWTRSESILFHGICLPSCETPHLIKKKSDEILEHCMIKEDTNLLWYHQVCNNSSTTGAISGTGTASPCCSGIHVSQFLVFCVVFCRSYFVRLILIPSDYLFGIFTFLTRQWW